MWSTFFYGIGDLCTAFFDLLPAVSGLVNGIFMFIIAFGIVFWTIYEQRVNKNKTKNFLGGEE